MRVKWLESRMSSIGMTAPEDLVDITEAAVEYRFHLSRLKPEEFSRLLNTVRQGYTTERSSLTTMLYTMLACAHQADEKNFPFVPPLSFIGKKSLSIRTAEGRSRAIANELIAYAQMVDAAFPARVVQARDRCVVIAAWDMPDPIPKAHGRSARKAAHLKPHFAGMMPLVRNWCSETVAEREPLINYLITVPSVPVRLVHRKEKVNAS